MPAYHSDFNKDTTSKMLGTIPLLPVKISKANSNSRGVAPPPSSDTEDDIIDEALSLFRANTFFRNFDIKGGADRILIYLTLYIQECLGKVAQKMPNQIEAFRILATHAVQNFPLPGDASFPLNSMFEKPQNRQDADLLKAYLTQLRQELGIRLLDRIYEEAPQTDNTKQPSKWWMCFAKRKFMNMSGVGTMG